MWYVFTDGKGKETVIQAADAKEAEKLYKEHVGEANYSFTHADKVIRKIGRKTRTWQSPS